ncbi:MAG TPA: DUF998 domain-containing protein [Methanocella sp.]|nr:DUF998 domain-containing protein [Methanocella sp.]
MKSGSFRLPVSSISALLAIIFFCMLVLVASVRYSGPYSPLGNFISDLGNSGLNPAGAKVFDGACVISGAFTILFFAGLNQWRLDDQWKLTVARLIGVFSGAALMLVGAFSEDYGKLHSIIASFFFISLIIAIISTDLVLRRHRSFLRLIGYYGVVVGLFSATYIGSYLMGTPIIIAEWITVLGALGWMGLLAWNMLRLPGASS